METITLTKEELFDAINDYLTQNTTIVGGGNCLNLVFDEEFGYSAHKSEPVNKFSLYMVNSIFDSQVVNKQ